MTSERFREPTEEEFTQMRRCVSAIQQLSSALHQDFAHLLSPQQVNQDNIDVEAVATERADQVVQMCGEYLSTM